MDAVNELSRNEWDIPGGAATASASAAWWPFSGGGLVGGYLALLLFMLIYCARPEDWIPGLSNAPLAKVAGTLAFLALLFSLRHIRRVPREIVYLALLIGQLFLASVLSPVWRGGAVQATLDFSKVFLAVAVVAVAVNSLRRLRLLIFTQAGSIAVIAAVTLWKGRSLLGRLNGVLGGPYGDPNDLALILVITLPLCLALLLLARGLFGKLVWATAIAGMAYTILLTGSRGGFLVLIVTSAMCIWSFAIRGRRPYLVALVAALAVIVSVSSASMIIGRLKGTFDASQDVAAAYASGQARQQLFWRSVEVTKENPLFGVGPGNFVQLSGDWHVAHNSYTQMSSEGGIPALALYLLILGSGFKNLRAAKRFAIRQRETLLLAKALHASLLGFVVGSFFLTQNYSYFPYFLIAYTTALFTISEKSDGARRAVEAARQTIATRPPRTAEQEFEMPSFSPQTQ